MMFSSSNVNTGDSDCFGEHSYGFMAPSSFQLGSSSSPAFVELDQFFVTNYLAMSQGLGLEEGNPDDRHSTLIGNGHDLVDGIMVAGSFDGNDKISCNLVMEEEVGRAKKNQTKAIGGSSNDENNKKDCQPVQTPTKRIRTGKKDRHSKISTAQGPRDRRMRLSLQIARKFFDLQDKLGFDKASKTIEWLFNMSKNAIREVMGNSYSRMDEPRVSYVDGTNNICSDNARKNRLVSPWSEYEEASEDIAINHKTYSYEYYTNNKLHMVNKHCRSMNKKLRRTQYVPNWPQLRKDDRDKARARARERTVEKMILKALKDPNQGLVATSREEQTGACTAFEHVDSSGARSQSVEELIHAEWEEIEEAKRLYSGYMFHDTTPHHNIRMS